MDRNYDDIINEKRPKTGRFEPMSAEMRAAQFAPFAALTGFEDELDETADSHRSSVLEEIEHEEAYDSL